MIRKHQYLSQIHQKNKDSRLREQTKLEYTHSQLVSLIGEQFISKYISSPHFLPREFSEQLTLSRTAVSKA